MPKLITDNRVQAQQRPRASAEAFGASGARATQQLGRTVINAASTLNAALDQRDRFGATKYQADLVALEQEVLANPNLEKREELFEVGKRKLAAQHRQGSGSTFDREAAVIDQRVGADFRHRNRLQAIEQGQSDLSDHLGELANEWALAVDDEDLRGETEERARRAVSSAVESGLIDERMAAEASERFARMGTRAELTRLFREDPEEAVLALSQPVEGFDEGERQELLTRAHGALAGVLREERLAAQAAERAAEEARKAQAEQVERQLIERDAAGSLTMADVQASLGLMTPERERLWVDRARSGGGGSGGGSGSRANRVLYMQLDSRARAGDPDVHADIRESYAAGRITKSDYDDLTDDELGARWGAGRRHLFTALDPGEVILSDAGAASMMAARKAEAEREFDRFRKANPDATADEVMARADHLAKTAMQEFDYQSVAAFNLKPTSLVTRSVQVTGANGSPTTRQEMDFDATEDMILDRFEASKGLPEEASVRAWARLERRLLKNLRNIEARSAQAAGQ